MGTRPAQKVTFVTEWNIVIRCRKNNGRNVGIEDWKNWLERGLGSIVKKHERNNLKSKA